MKTGYYSVFSNGKTYDNLIDLRSRPIEERRAIARLGGLARQEQRRQQLTLRKLLNFAINDAEDLIEKYIEKPKHNKVHYTKSFMVLMQEYEEALELERIEKESRKKQIRKEINRRYYLKRKERLAKD